MKLNSKLTLLLFAGVAVSPAMAWAKKPPELSGLQLQQIQSRDFEATKNVAFSAVMSVLQDAGYRIGAADKDTGLITASASTKSKLSYNLFTGFGKSKKTPVVSAYIEDRGPTMSRVRLAFVMGKMTNSSSFGGVSDEEPINDPAVYQETFEKINQAVFVRQAMDAPATVPSSAPSAATTPISATPTLTAPVLPH